MLNLKNLRIGTKMTAMAAGGILLMGVLVAAQVLGNNAIGNAKDNVVRRAGLVQETLQAQTAIRSMQVSVRDLRLARVPEDIAKAKAGLDQRLKTAEKHVTRAIELSSIAATIERLKTINDLARKYAATSQKFAEFAVEIHAIRTKNVAAGSQAVDASNRIAALEAEAAKFAGEQTLPIAAKMDELVDKIAEGVVDRMNGSADEAARAMASNQRVILLIGVGVIAVLIGSAFFGAFNIAKPLKKIASTLQELTHDRIVDVPYANRGDEIGDIAKATEMFKDSIAQKVINLRVRSGLDVVRSNVMIADDNYNIMYLNASLDRMMKEAETELRKVLPQFDAGKLVGGNMDVFHKNPEHQRKLLDALTGMHESHIAVGSQKFHLVATPVIDEHGKRSGTVVEWRNETVEKAIETEVDDLVKAAVAGDFSQRVPLSGKKDFMLNLATAMNSLCENTGNALQDLNGMLSALAEGDLTKRIGADYQGMFGALKNDANTMAERIGTTIGEIKASAAEVTNASAEISTSTTDLSQRTEEQAASLEETSASMEEISATVKKNAENAQAANQSAASTREVADRGGQVVADAVKAMAKIEESSRKIGDIIGVIDEIARQTNLLALNAAVEAARAGEAGRGFAVVASEVRSLAQRSSQAAKDIKDLITNSNGQVKEGVDLVNRAGASLNEIVDSIKKVAEIVADIANASGEQATGIEQVNKALTQMDEVTQQNSALVEENAATAKTLEHQAQAMDGRVAYFRIAVGSDVAPAAPPPKQAVAALPPHRGPAAKAPPADKPAAAPKRAAAANGGGGPVGKMQAALAVAVNEPADWKEF